MKFGFVHEKNQTTAQDPEVVKIREELARREQEAAELEAKARDLTSVDSEASIDAGARAAAVRQLLQRLKEKLDGLLLERVESKYAVAAGEIDVEAKEKIENFNSECLAFERAMCRWGAAFNDIATHRELHCKLMSLFPELHIARQRAIFLRLPDFIAAERVQHAEHVRANADVKKQEARFEIEHEVLGDVKPEPAPAAANE